jgi:branched-chain amino acid transport system substrate-binding protein
MIKRLLALLVVTTFVATIFVGCGSKKDTIKIGSLQPISGKMSVYGTQSRDAINMAVKEINDKGGILGKTLEVVIYDDEGTPEKTKNAFTKLVTKDKVVGIVGALASNCTLAITEDAQARKMVLISPTSTNDAVTDAGDYIFRACYKDSFQGPVVAQFSYDQLKAKKAAILFDNTNPYSVGMKDNFKKKFEELGGTVTVESYAAGDKDFSAQLTKIKATNPEVMFIPDYYNTVALIAKAAKDAGLTAPMIGADGWDGVEGVAKDEIVGSYFSNHYSADADDNEVKTFVSNFKKAYKDVTPNALSALAYDATYILAEAIEKAGSTDSAKIKDAMMQTDKKFVTGQIKFNEHRDPIKSITMVKIVKGDDGKNALQFAGVVNP